ncbi:MAG: nuclear transport factor 2 family protein [Chitinophagaceae bacterium]
MKKTITRFMLVSIAAITAFITPLKAQDDTRDLSTFTKKFQDTYNKHNEKALKMMYTDDAVRIGTDGTTLTGNEAISAEFAKSFADIKPVIEITQNKAEKQADGNTVATGTYHLKGTTAAGESVDLKGSYVNTVVKVKGQWKIVKSVLTAM